MTQASSEYRGTPSEAPSPGRVVTARMRTLRTARGWSAQELADAVNRLGVPWTRSVVANLESGRRTDIGVDELFTLGAVFKVSPVALLVPDTESAVATTPYRESSASDALDLLTGGAGEVAGLPEWAALAGARRRARERVHAATARLLDLDIEVEDPRTGAEEQVYQAERAEARAQLREARRAASELGALGDVPRVRL